LKGVKFNSSEFHNQTFFDSAQFNKYAIFTGVKFSKWVVFDRASFSDLVHFNLVDFKSDVSFRNSIFQNDVLNTEIYFSGARFNHNANFQNSKFDLLFFNREYPADFLESTRELNRTRFIGKTDFTSVTFNKTVKILNTLFDEEVIFNKSTFKDNIILNDVKINKANFALVEFHGEIDFYLVDFSFSPNSVLIDFANSTFRNRVRFNGTVTETINLSSVSFKGVDLSNTEFNYVKWLQTTKYRFFQRNIIIDEKILDEGRNYEDVIKIYNQLRKNYESRLLFNDASHFFVGEMESRRKTLRNSGIIGWLTSLYYQIYRRLAWYGESISLPLLVWSPLTITFFTLFRLLGCVNTPELESVLGTLDCPRDPNQYYWKQVIDSILAFFPLPISKNSYDTLEHLIAIPILGTAFIALKRKFERSK
jgi:uncharacterized protein YjbI with pentapeptide repeats